MIRLFKKIQDVLWPRGLKCLCCDMLSEGELLCPTCITALQAMQMPAENCSLGRAKSVYKYDGVAKQLVRMLKYQCTADAAEPLAEGMAAAIRAMDLPKDTVLTWVTMPRERLRVRGIDHGQTLCNAVAERTGMSMRQMLVRCGRVHTQQGLNREERMRNLPGTMACPERLTGPVLLIDDVMTTGATAEVCSDILLKAGASAVYVVTATRVV